MKENKKPQRSTSEMRDYRKESIEREDNVYVLLREMKIEGLRIERSPRIDNRFQPDFVLYNGRECIAVIEVKTSLMLNTKLIDKTLNAVRSCCEITQTKKGYVTDGTDAIDVENNKTSLAAIIELLENESHENKGVVDNPSPKKLETVRTSLKKHLKLISNKEKQKNISDFIQSLNIEDIANDSECSLTDKKEKELMHLILGKYTEKTICRYTSMSGLFRTLNDKKQSMVCLVGMNDRSEIDYVDSYASNNISSGGNPAPKISYTNSSFDLLNNLYILSCCDNEKEDNLTMFRLYGDDSRGVCMKYTVEHDKIANGDFFLAPVSYADENGNHPEFDYVLNTNVNTNFCFRKFEVWKHFFKNHDYEIENEVRFIYESEVGKGGK